jgi:hypothetical protein
MQVSRDVSGVSVHQWIMISVAGIQWDSSQAL